MGNWNWEILPIPRFGTQKCGHSNYTINVASNQSLVCYRKRSKVSYGILKVIYFKYPAVGVKREQGIPANCMNYLGSGLRPRSECWSRVLEWGPMSLLGLTEYVIFSYPDAVQNAWRTPGYQRLNEVTIFIFQVNSQDISGHSSFIGTTHQMAAETAR